MGAKSSPFLGTLQPESGDGRSLGYFDMGKRRSKSERPPTLIRTYVADNLVDLMDRTYPADKYKTTTARRWKLAEDSGVSKNQIDRIIAKSQGTSVDQLEWLAAPLGVRPQDLVTPYFTRSDRVTPISSKRRKA